MQHYRRPSSARRTRSRRARLLLAGAMLTPLAACADSDPGVVVRNASNHDPVDTLEWGECDDDAVFSDEFECATLSVELYPEDPTGETIDLALIRLPASGQRVGAILFNPGGPGGSGFEYVAAAAPSMVDEIGLEDFDLIGFDPRGVDRSNGLRCLSDEDLDRYANLDDTPDDAEEEALLAEADTAFEQGCIDNYGDTLSAYSTINTAHDMEAIRVALGDETISYFGVSYGTYLGGVYATMFPDRVRAMILDSAYEPGGDSVEEQYMTQLVGFESAFDDWAVWCEDTPDQCAFTSDDVGAAWDDLRDLLDADPITASDGREANRTVMEGATTAALYSPTMWPVLGGALQDVAEDGDADALFRLIDSYNGREPDGSYATIQQSNAIIACASGFESDTPDDPEALADELRAAAPRFGADIQPEDLVADSMCDELMPAQPLAEIAYAGDAPIVVIGGQNDPATPFRWAEELTDAMGSNVALVTYTGEGHGQVLVSACINDIERAALVDLEIEQATATCDPDPAIEQPSWWGDVPTLDIVGPVLDDPELSAAFGLTPTQLYGELHTTRSSPTAVLEAYRSALEDAGFVHLGEQEPLPGAQQAVYGVGDSDDLFSVVVLGEDTFADPQFADLADLLPAGENLVALLYLPL